MEGRVLKICVTLFMRTLLHFFPIVASNQRRIDVFATPIRGPLLRWDDQLRGLGGLHPPSQEERRESCQR